MPIALGQVPFEVAKVAAHTWQMGSSETARKVFAEGLFPTGVQKSVVDLGTGDGRFAIALGERYPGSSIWAVDQDDLPALTASSGRTDLPPNLLNGGGFSFDDFVRAARGTELGPPLVFDLVYILYPNPSAIGAFLAAAMEVVSPEGEIHLVTEAPHVAEEAEKALLEGGFLCRSVPLPSEVGSVTACGRTLASSEPVHWVVARRYRPGEFVIPSLDRQPVPRWPDCFWIDRGAGKKKFQEGEKEKVEKELSELFFGREISVDSFLKGVGSTPPGIFLEQLVVRQTNEGKVSISGMFMDESVGFCGDFSRAIPPPPPPGKPWIAEGYGFNAYAQEGRRRIVNRTKKGLARAWHQSFFSFLAWLGVDEFQLTATNIGKFAWPRLGFDFRDEQVKRWALGDFEDWLPQRPSSSLPTREKARSLSRAWELADFTDENGRELGREFLLWHGQHVQAGLKETFFLHPSSHGWRQLFKNQAGKVS